LRFFDHLKFHEVSHDELQRIRRDFPLGRHQIEIEPIRFRLADHLAVEEKNAASIESFPRHREAAFEAELARWNAEGQFHFDSETGEKANEDLPQPLEEHQHSLDSPVSGSVWQQLVPAGTRVKAGAPVLIL